MLTKSNFLDWRLSTFLRQL